MGGSSAWHRPEFSRSPPPLAKETVSGLCIPPGIPSVDASCFCQRASGRMPTLLTLATEYGCRTVTPLEKLERGLVNLRSAASQSPTSALREPVDRRQISSRARSKLSTTGRTRGPALAESRDSNICTRAAVCHAGGHTPAQTKSR